MTGNKPSDYQAACMKGKNSDKNNEESFSGVIKGLNEPIFFCDKYLNKENNEHQKTDEAVCLIGF